MKARHSIKQGAAIRQVSPVRPLVLPARAITPTKAPTAAQTSQTKPNIVVPATVAAPKLPDCDGIDLWINPSQACAILGISRGGIYKLLDQEEPLLIVKRPLPRKILVSLRSVKALSEATKDPEFWQLQVLQDELRAKLRQMVTG